MAVTKKKKVVKKRKIAIAILPFTHYSVIYKVGDTFKGEENQINYLINKNLIQWEK